MKTVKISKDYVTSKYDKEDIKMFQNELFFYLLSEQKNLSFIPELVHYDCNKLIIKTKNVGISLEQYCYEYEKECDDFLPKIKIIDNRLVKLGYYHNDLRFKNILINPETKKLYLIDFEFTDQKYKDKDDENLVKTIKKISNTKKK